MSQWGHTEKIHNLYELQFSRIPLQPESRISVPKELMAQQLEGGVGHERVESAKYVGPLNMLLPADCSERPCRCSDRMEFLDKGKIFGSEERQINSYEVSLYPWLILLSLSHPWMHLCPRAYMLINSLGNERQTYINWLIPWTKMNHTAIYVYRFLNSAV